jgi:hypothetical protein
MASGEEIRTAGLHPQTQHRIHHLPSVIYADNTSSLLHHDIGANAVVTEIEQDNGHT